MLKFLHAADFHLDSPFSGLTPEQAVKRRRESRELLFRLADCSNEQQTDLVLLAGDLFDGDTVYRETPEAICEALRRINAPVFIAPGNHDPCRPDSPYRTMEWPDNVHIFTENHLKSFELPDKNITVWGAAFTSEEQTQSLLQGFSVPKDGRQHLMVLHGDWDVTDSPYNAVTRQQAADSGLAYLALGHIHKRSEPMHCGKTTVAYPGCPEGRGFDELGDKGCYLGTVDDGGQVTVTFVQLARHRYCILNLDITGTLPRTALDQALSADRTQDVCRVVFTGETDAVGVDKAALIEKFSSRCYSLTLRDQTTLCRDLWEGQKEDSLRGLFLRELRQQYDKAQSDAERETITNAVRCGLAALDHRDLH